MRERQATTDPSPRAKLRPPKISDRRYMRRSTRSQETTLAAIHQAHRVV
jgi:hypothetical protein